MDGTFIEQYFRVALKGYLEFGGRLQRGKEKLEMDLYNSLEHEIDREESCRL